MPHFTPSSPGCAARKSKAPQCVECKIGRRGIPGQRPKFLLRGSEPAVVVAKHGDAPPGQEVGDHQEGLVPEELLVAVLQPAARDEHYGGPGRCRVGKRQRARKRHTPGARGERDLATAVGKGRPRRLGPHGRLAPRQHKREGPAELGETADDHAAGQERSPERGVECGDPKAELTAPERERIDGNAPDSLIGAVERGPVAAPGTVDAEYNRQPGGIGGEGPVPHPGKILGRQTRRQEQRKQKKQMQFHVPDSFEAAANGAARTKLPKFPENA